MDRREHDFASSLAVSNRYRDAGWWMPLYRQAFPTLASAVAVNDDGWAQRGGIDRLLTLSSGKTFAIDEKIRTKDWPDILLEVWSDEARQIAGWVQKPLACDFIAYAYAPSGVCYLLPVEALQRAWRRRGSEWTKRFGVRRAFNRTYVSVNVPVPRAELMSAITEALVIAPEARFHSG